MIDSKSQTSTRSDETRSPNILMLVADDQAFRSIGSLNNPEVHTPNLDRLVARGTTFTHAHHQGAWHGAVCVASRAMLHTGRMLYHCGGDDCGDHPMIGGVLGEQGYHTFCTGKWHNWEHSRARSFQQLGPDGGGMYDSSTFDFRRLEPTGDPSRSAYLRPAPGNTWTADDRSLGGHWLPDEQDPTGFEHSSTRWTRSTIDYLIERQATAPDVPFFAYCAFHAPHDPRQADTPYLERYPLDEVQLPPNALPEHPFNQGDYDLRDEQLAPWPRTDDVIRAHRQEYHAILTHMDEEIGRILDHLDATGQTENTLIVFTADHGLAVGEHGLMGKQNMYDHSVRIPLIFAGPGVPAGQTCDALVYQHSAFATLADLGNFTAPESLQFPSLAPLLSDPQVAGPHETVYSSYRHFQRMCRDQNHKLILYPHLGRWQLFNTTEDPFEINDLALEEGAKETYRAIIDRLFNSLKQWQQTVGDQLVIQISDYRLG